MDRPDTGISVPDGVDRRTFLQAATAGGTFMIAGCADEAGDDVDAGDDGDVAGGSGDDEETDALTLLTYEPLEDGDPTEMDDPAPIQVFLRYLIEEFEAETGIEIAHQSLSIEEWRTQGNSILGGSGAPAVSESMPGPGEVGDLVHAGHFTTLQDKVDPAIIEARDVNGWTFEDGRMLNYGVGDDVYGIPHYMSGLPLWFNIPVLEDAGVDYERLRHANDVTWEEFNDICEQVKDAGYIPMAMGNRVGGHIPYKFSVAVNKTVGHEAVFEVLDPESDRQINDPEFVEALELVEEWWDRGFINEDHLSLDEDEGETYFFQNEAAFITDGIWISYLWDAVSDPDELGPMGEGWDYMWWPYRPDVYEDGKEELLGFNVGAYGISSRAEEQGLLDDAVEWLNYYMSEEIAQFRADHGDRIPSHQAVDIGPEVQAAMHDDLTSNVQATRTDDMLLPEFASELTSTGQLMFSDEMTPQEVLDACQEALDDGVERYE
ncbi:extracellular solute-binding protein [Halorubrum sp. JWXQ-INN 858]|uniref:ABC transporter substrate-binding protein n=1 Tax=Halorubrum sp. JWXQ-INN 858 TaxID=2690782 RepID=UPI00135C555A|nr:extracellular solute-binding protein [Halorubrum sp. JWXQ-INN 858]MWV65623.1 extracellular solute-binding protein [Halorubrum sp. JWXQ-INN 858]